MSDSSDSDIAATRERLIDAGLQVFRDKGFADASVREICATAGANLSAVSYHFSGKEGLYREVLRRARERMARLETMPRLEGWAGDAWSCLDAWLDWNVHRLIGNPENRELVELLHHELRSPSPLLEEVVVNGFGPIHDELMRLVAAVRGSEPEDPETLHLAIMVMGQCLIYKTGQPILERLPAMKRSGQPVDASTVSAVVRRFVRGGLQTMRDADGERS